MKYKKSFFTGLFFLTIIFSCKKYGYDFQNGYDKSADSSAVTTDTSGFEVDRSMFEKARIFPGLVDDAERRIADTTILLNLNYTYVEPSRLGFKAVPQPIFSTGLYAGPGERVEITVPAGVYGLTAQVGFHTDNLSGMSPLRREPLVYTVKALFPGINSIRNPFGGYLWIKTEIPVKQEVALKFKGAVKSPDFILGAMTVDEWKKSIIASKVPWLELRSKHSVFSVSRELVLRNVNEGKLNEIDKTMAEWDEVILKDFYLFNGLVENSTDLKKRAPELPERRVQDVQLTGGVYAHVSGQPLFVLSDSYWFDEWTNINTLKGGKSVGTFQQLGSNYQASNGPWWSGIEQTVASFSIFKTANRNGIVPEILNVNGVREMFPKAIAYAQRDSGKYLNGDAQANFAMFKLTPFIQIFSKITNPSTGEDGWAFNAYLLNKARNSPLLGTDNLSKSTFVYTTLCEYTKKDFASFFDAWGIPITDYYRNLMQNTYPPLDVALWEYNPVTKQGGTRHYIDRRLYHVRSNWNIIASSEETSEGGGIAALIDGNPENFWHTCWRSCAIPNTSPVTSGPHLLTFDMKQVNSVNGFFIASRRGGTRPNSVEITVSNDRINWETLGTYQLEDKNNNQYLTLPQAKSFQYFKMTLTGYSGLHVALAEVGTFYYRP